MQPLQFIPVSTLRLSYPKRFAANVPAPQPTAKTTVKPQFSLGSFFLKFGLYTLPVTLVALIGHGFLSPNFAERRDTRGFLYRSLDKPKAESSQKPSLTPQEIQKEQVRLYQGMATAFSLMSKAGSGLEPVFKALDAHDLAFTQSLLEKYKKQPRTSETYNKIYTEWSNEVLLPRLGAEKTHQYQAVASQYMKEAGKRDNVELALAAALMYSLMNIYVGGAGKLLEHLQKKEKAASSKTAKS